MKKELYEVYISQKITTTIPTFLGLKQPKIEPHTILGHEKVILASTQEEAIEKYKQRYKTNFTGVIDPYFNLMNEYKLNTIENTILCNKVMYSLNYLKENMRADEFLEYCKQELYDVSECIK